MMNHIYTTTSTQRAPLGTTPAAIGHQVNQNIRSGPSAVKNSEHQIR
jgi:hypothetical protein